MAKIDELRARVATLIEEAEEIQNAATDDGDLTDEQVAEARAKTDEIARLTRQIDVMDSIANASAMVAGTGRKTAPEPRAGAGAANAGGRDLTVYRQPKVANGGFKSLGHFALEVMASGKGDGQATERLMNAASTYSQEGVGPDGGFAVPPDFRADIVQKVQAPDSLLSLTDKLTSASNSITIPKDETTPWVTAGVAGGITVYWEGEAATIPQSKVALEQTTIRLNKLAALVPVTDELLEDAPALDGYLRNKASAKMIAKINDAIVNGTGTGMPRGILNSGSIATVNAEGSQVADTVIYPNIVKMWNALYGPWRRNAVWLINQDLEPQLDMLDFRPTATAPTTPMVPVYLPGNTISGAGYNTLKGRPVIPCEACQKAGDLGDIILVDLNQYMTATKGQDIRTDVSIHLFFDQGVTAFRFIMRVAGQPWWSSAIKSQNGLIDRSWAAVLQAR